MGLSISYLALKYKEEDFTFIDAMKYKYLLVYGEFDVDDGPAFWVLFVISTIVIPLVMLNMLIAVMTDTYNRVMNDIIPSNYS